MNIFEAAQGALTEEEKAIEVFSTEITAPNYWKMTFFVDDKFYTVDILHREEDMKNVSCSYCEANDCLHIRRAYHEITKELAKPVQINLEEALEPFTKQELITMLVQLTDYQVEPLTPYLYPKAHSVEEVEQLLQEPIQLLEKGEEDEAISALQNLLSNVYWLQKKDRYLAVQHMLVCIKQLTPMLPHCDDFISFLLQSYLDMAVKEVTDAELAKRITHDLIATLDVYMQQPTEGIVTSLFEAMIKLSKISQMKREIEASLQQHQAFLLATDPPRYESYMLDIYFATATRKERGHYYTRTDLSLFMSIELLSKARDYQDYYEGFLLCERLLQQPMNPRVQQLIEKQQAYFEKQLQN